MSVLQVGSSQQYTTISAAVAASRDGDIIQVRAGTYTDDFATIGTKVTIQGVGGMVNLIATQAPPNGKAALVTTTDVTLDHIAFSGVKVPDGNGAGIRYEGGNLTITNCQFVDNQEGLLAAADPNGTITIRNSEFARNGTGDGYTHNLYVGQVKQLTITDSLFREAVVGHEIKSRALNTTILNTRIEDGATGSASYAIDLPNGGNVLIKDTLIQKGTQSQNPALIHFGGEGTPYAGSSLQLTGDTFVNDRSSANLVLNAAGAPVTASGLSSHGLSTAQLGALAGSTTMLSARPAVDASSPVASTPTSTSGAGTATGTSPATGAGATGTMTSPSSDTIVLHVSEDAWRGDAQYVVSVDGKQVGGVRTATASHAAGKSDTVKLDGEFKVGAHNIALTFTNDAWGGTASTDRNLYFDSVELNGVSTKVGKALLSNGTASATVPASSTTGTTPATGTGTTSPSGDALVLHVSEDAWRGDAQFIVSVDGKQVGGVRTATASHAAGKSEAVKLEGLFGASAHDIAVTFLNDDWGGKVGADRNLYVDSIDRGSQHYGSATAQLFSNGTAHLTLPALSANS